MTYKFAMTFHTYLLLYDILVEITTVIASGIDLFLINTNICVPFSFMVFLRPRTYLYLRILNNFKNVNAYVSDLTNLYCTHLKFNNVNGQFCDRNLNMNNNRFHHKQLHVLNSAPLLTTCLW